MARGIIIIGSAGAGKTTLGRLTAEALGFPYFDIDDYIWRADTDRPFTVMYSREEKAARLMAAISRGERFVMAGSMDSFNAPFVPLFDLAVHLTAPADVRVARLRRRACERYGDRVLPGGDLYESHERFYDSAARYDTDASPSYAVHASWLAGLPCLALRLSGEAPLAENVAAIAAAYREATRG